MWIICLQWLTIKIDYCLFSVAHTICLISNFDGNDNFFEIKEAKADAKRERERDRVGKKTNNFIEI